MKIISYLGCSGLIDRENTGAFTFYQSSLSNEIFIPRMILNNHRKKGK